jgi:Methyltransferase domain
MPCKVCGAATNRLFSAKVLNKYDVGYHRCVSCGFIQTEDPFWLEESYCSAINEIDIGPINRAVTSSKLIESLILSTFDPNGKFIDYGAGYGVLVRLMRDRGFDFFWYDLYCQNVFAKHFVARPDVRFELLTAFEVFEHLQDPVSGVKVMLEYADSILFSTLLAPAHITKASDWWYLGPEHGQHVSFFTLPSLQALGDRFGLHLSTDGSLNHLLSRKKVSTRQFRFFAGHTRLSYLTQRLLRRRLSRQSLLEDDFRAISGYTL